MNSDLKSPSNTLPKDDFNGSENKTFRMGRRNKKRRIKSVAHNSMINSRSRIDSGSPRDGKTSP